MFCIYGMKQEKSLFPCLLYKITIYTRTVPEVRRQRLKCFKMTSDIDITLHVCTCTCVFHIVDISKQLCRTLHIYGSLHVRSTLKYLAVTLIRTVNNEAKFLW